MKQEQATLQSLIEEVAAQSLELAALRAELEQVKQENKRLREALEKVIGRCGPSPDGSFRRLDKIFGELMDIAWPVLHPELYKSGALRGE